MSYFDGVRGETVGCLSLLASQGELDKLQEALANDGGRERWRAADNKGWQIQIEIQVEMHMKIHIKSHIKIHIKIQIEIHMEVHM